jgi:CRP/FNR family cyclic AMP-dependent transcriptional regulator
MLNKIDLLETIEIFQDLTPAEMEDIGHQTVMRTFQAGHLFYMPSDPGEVLFTLKHGRVQLYRLAPNGRKLVVSILHPGAVFGQMGLVGQHLHRTFAQALEECVVCVMSREEVEKLLLEKPQIAIRFLNALGRRLEEAERRLEEFAFKDVPTRLAGLLIQLNTEAGGNGTLKGYTHQYLADMLGTYRETTTQILNEFQQQNLIRLSRKSIEIVDAVGLETLSSEM